MRKEEWRMIPGYEGLYMVSSIGRVKNCRTGKIMKPFEYKGYLQISLTKNGIRKTYRVHRLVAMAFIPNPNNLPEVNHKDEDGSNNCVDNLEWCTRKYNNNYGTRVTRAAKKKSIKVAQYTPDFPCELIKVWSSATEASRELRKQGVKVYDSNINRCCNGQRKTAGGFGWGWWEE